MDSLPVDVIAEILAKSDHDTKRSALLVNKTFWRVLDTFDDIWTEAEFRRYDDTLIGFFQRHRVRAVRLMCTPEDAFSVLTRCDVSALRALTMRFEGAEFDFPAVTLNGLEHLDVTFGRVERLSSFIVPRSDTLRTIRVLEKNIQPRVDVVFETGSRDVTDLDVRARSFSAKLPNARSLRRVRVVQDMFVADEFDPDVLRDADLESLELDVVGGSDTYVKNIRTENLTVRTCGWDYYGEPFRAEHLTFAFSDTDCALSLHRDVLSAAKTISVVSGIPGGRHMPPCVSWHVTVERAALSELGALSDKMTVDNRASLGFLHVVT